MLLCCVWVASTLTVVFVSLPIYTRNGNEINQLEMKQRKSELNPKNVETGRKHVRVCTMRFRRLGGKAEGGGASFKPRRRGRRRTVAVYDAFQPAWTALISGNDRSFSTF